MATSSIHGFFIIFAFCLTAGEKCEDSTYRTKLNDSNAGIEDGKTVIGEYSCPREFDPITFTRCCRDGKCCEKLLMASNSQFDQILMRATAIVVITLCMVLTAGIVVCCFWSRCPFYNTCRANYNSSDVIIYSLAREDDPHGLMPEQEPTTKGYTPLNVKIKRMEEV